MSQPISLVSFCVYFEISVACLQYVLISCFVSGSPCYLASGLVFGFFQYFFFPVVVKYVYFIICNFILNFTSYITMPVNNIIGELCPKATIITNMSIVF